MSPSILSGLAAMGAGPGAAAPWLAALAAATLALIAIMMVAARLRPRDARVMSGRRPPSLAGTDCDEAGWLQAAVPRTPLLIRYQEPDGVVTERVIRPKAIRGSSHGVRVRPDAVVAYCEMQRATCTFRYRAILSAADARTGEYVDDLYAYLGSAQPGGAPAQSYR